MEAILLGLLVVGLATFWDEIKIWLKEVGDWIVEVVKHVLYGTKVLLRKLQEGFAEIARFYHQDARQRWHETTRMREIAASEVPREIRERMATLGIEVEITKDVDRELRMHLA